MLHSVSCCCYSCCKYLSLLPLYVVAMELLLLLVLQLFNMLPLPLNSLVVLLLWPLEMLLLLLMLLLPLFVVVSGFVFTALHNVVCFCL